MSAELRAYAGTGNTLYANVVAPSARRWNGTTFVVYSSGAFGTYAVTLTEQGSSGVYVGNFPAGISDAAVYEIYYYVQAGGSPAEGDSIAGIESIDWNGSIVIPSGSVSPGLITGSGSGNTIYAHVMSSSGQRWNGTAFETYAAGSYPNYDITMTEQGSSGIYTGTFPVAIVTAGFYDIVYYLQQGGSPAEGDPVAGNSTVNWDGSTFVTTSETISGYLSIDDWYAYVVRTYKRTDKATELYDATNEAIAEIRRTIQTGQEEKETALTQQVTTLGQYKLNVESDFGLMVSDVYVRDSSKGTYLTPISKAMFDYLYSRWSTTSDHRSRPRHWCLFGNQILLGPVPDSIAYTYVTSYSKDDHVLVSASTMTVPFTNTAYREILKHGVLARLYALVENDVQAQKYHAFWMKGLGEIDQRENRNRRKYIAVAYQDF